MSEQKSFFSTLPGILTALAGLVTAVAGLIYALSETGLIGSRFSRLPERIPGNSDQTPFIS